MFPSKPARRPVLRLALAVSLGTAFVMTGCADQETATVDSGSKLVRERVDALTQQASDSLGYHRTLTEAAERFTVPEVLDYTVENGKVTWRLFVVATGRDDRFMGSTSTLQIATCVQLTGADADVEATTIGCPRQLLHERGDSFDREVDVLD